jgi:hypothetical protein
MERMRIAGVRKVLVAVVVVAIAVLAAAGRPAVIALLGV